MLDKAEEKAEFDKVLQLSTDQAAAQKAIADKALLDVGELHVGDAQQFAAVHMLAEAICGLRLQLSAPVAPAFLQASAACAKAQFDKYVADKAEEKAEFDRALEHSAQKAAAQKAVADKALLDMGEMQVSIMQMHYGSGLVRMTKHGWVRRALARTHRWPGTRRSAGTRAAQTPAPLAVLVHRRPGTMRQAGETVAQTPATHNRVGFPGIGKANALGVPYRHTTADAILGARGGHTTCEAISLLMLTDMFATQLPLRPPR